MCTQGGSACGDQATRLPAGRGEGPEQRPALLTLDPAEPGDTRPVSGPRLGALSCGLHRPTCLPASSLTSPGRPGQLWVERPSTSVSLRLSRGWDDAVNFWRECQRRRLRPSCGAVRVAAPRAAPWPRERLEPGELARGPPPSLRASVTSLPVWY